MKNLKNSIWYRFSSEKVSYEIKFETTDIPVKDVKNKIIKRRNMIKYPERFDLIFYDEENPSKEIEENHLIKPMKHLIVKRIPHYSREANFRKEIKDPKDIPMNKMNENGLRRGELQQIIRYKEPLEKIARYLKKDLLNKQFRCKLCEKFDQETYNNFIISKCCKETFCLNCYNKEAKCPSCKSDKIGFVKNEAETNLIKKLLDILEKKEEQEKLKKEKSFMQSNSKIIQKNSEANNPISKNNFSSNNIGNTQGENKIPEPLSSYQLQRPLIEESQFFIVKSSNAENIQKSKNMSLWATTTASSSRLNQAFSKGNVILFFCVGSTQYFKGYAIMTSFCADTPSNNIWLLDKNKNIKLGGDFSVSWLCYCELPFLKAKYLNINKSRDCTPLEQNIGIQLCELCYGQEKEELERNPQRLKIEINEQTIAKINETINNNRNKQNEKLNGNNINNNKMQQLNELNKVQSNISINEPNNVQIQNPQMVYPAPIYPLIFTYPSQMIQFQMQKNLQGVNPQNNINEKMVNQQQQQKKEQKQDNEKKENKKEKKKSRHSRRRSRSRSRSRDKSRSKSRNKNKSRSSRSRRSNSSSSRSEGRSKYSKSYK